MGQACRGALWAVGLWLAGMAAAAAQMTGETVTIRAPVDHDLYTAGRFVDVLADVNGDLVAAGQSVTVARGVSGDVMAAAQRVTLRGAVGDDVRAVGREVVLEGSVGDHVVAAGESVTLASGSTVGGRAWLAGRTVRLSGTVAKAVRVAAGEVIVTGDIGGDLTVDAERIDIAPGAHIGGSFTWHGSTPPRISPEARIDGPIHARPVTREVRPEAALLAVAAGAALLLSVTLAVTGVVLLLLFPTGMQAAAEAIRLEPLKIIGLGLVGLVVTPAVVLLLFITAIGALLGAALLALYLVALLVGTIVGLFFVGESGLRLLRRSATDSRGLGVLALVIATAVVAVLQWIPLFGFVIGLLLLLAGLGAVQQLLYQGFRPAAGR